jgi:hypothetical protein
MVPNLFPLLLVIPAAGMDWILERRPDKAAGWGTALLLAAAFLGLFFATQWLFSDFMLSPWARNWFFAGDRNWDYSQTLGDWRYEHWNLDEDPVTARGLGTALALACVSTRIGLWWGAWMARVRR